MEDFNYDEFLFRVRDIECEVKAIDAQTDKLKLERDKLIYELNEMDKVYEQHIKEVEPTKELKEEKPKKLKKTNDKSSENHIEVQFQEGRS